MNDNLLPSIADERLLAAMKAANPSVEKLMADRLALRQEIRRTKGELEHVRHNMIPRFIGAVKVIALGAATLALVALALALFKGLFEVKTAAVLFAALLLPIWIVDQAEAKFGRWVMDRHWRTEFLALLWQKGDFWDSLSGECVIHEEPAFGGGWRWTRIGRWTSSVGLILFLRAWATRRGGGCALLISLD